MTDNDSSAMAKLAVHPSTPDWARKLLGRGEDFETASSGVSCQKKKLDASYLGFLREQIEVAARGPEWNALLSARLRAYERVIDLDLLLVEVWDTGARFFAYLRASDLDVVYVESSQ